MPTNTTPRSRRPAKATEPTTPAPRRRRTRKAAAVETPAVETPAASEDRVERTALAKAEHKALAAWIKAGSEGDRPATPNLDAMNDQYQAGGPKRTRTAKKSTSTRAPQKAQGLRFYHDGNPMPDSQNKLSSVAWYYTKGIAGDAARISTADLIALLAKAGVETPNASAWEVKLPNGITLAARMDGETKAPAKARRTRKAS